MASWNSATSVCIGSDFGVTMVGLMASILSLSVSLVMKHDSSLVEDARVKLEPLEMEPLLLLGSSLWFLLVLSTCSVVAGCSADTTKLSSAGMSNRLFDVCRKLMSGVAVGGFPWFLLGVDRCFM